MRLVDRKTFLQTQGNILYRVISDNLYNKGEPNIKYENLSDDWFYYDLLDEIKIKGEDTPEDSSEQHKLTQKILENKDLELKLDSVCARDGMYEFSNNYLIYEEEDIKEIISRLEECLKNNQKGSD